MANHTKHTIKHAKKLAKEYSKGKSSFKVFQEALEQNFIDGYLKAIEETNVTELLDILIFSNTFPIQTESQQTEVENMALKLGWKIDMPLENFAIELRINAIKKATE